jgi:hypothetical protein
MSESAFTRLYGLSPIGYLRRRRNLRDMQKTLERIKDVVESD